MKASRLLSILMLLQSRGRATAPELAAHLEVSVRTILRDVDELSAAGVPVHASRGQSGGLWLSPGWRTDLTGLTAHEAQAMALATLPIAADQVGLGAAASSAQAKLLAGLGPKEGATAREMAQRLHIDLIDWYREHERPEYLVALSQAVWRDRCIEVRYRSWQRTRHHLLEPLGLVLKAGVWYLVARAVGQEEARTYRVSGIEQLAVAAHSFRRPRHFDLADHWRTATQRFEAERYRVQAQVWLSPRAISWLDNTRTPFARLPAGASSPPGADWVRVRLPLESIEHGTRTLLAFGTEVQVIGPRALVASMTRMIRGLALRYAVERV